ncbi:hypothetical protein [Kocuria rosea]|uniref:hypothetical protein n=1 Tax=Kocuria rosea TaxID=1275 RepID=UPI0025B79FF5|nr:hypothetical protein [Kocuria rosea]WJZ68624.1 hypothetical protein QR564_18820 [Kocuria rosea]
MDPVIVDPRTWPYRRGVELSRFLFATQTPVPLPDKFHFTGALEAMGTGHSVDDVNWISVVVHQIVGDPGQGLRAARAVEQIASPEETPTLGVDRNTAPELQGTWSVIEAVTPDETTAIPDPQAPAHSRTWAEDPLMRVIYGLRQLVRAERVGAQALSAIPAYEQIMNPVLAYRGIGEQLLAGAEADARVLTTSFPEWGSPTIVVLEHGNLSRDYVQTRHKASQFDLVLSKWLVDLELELPGILWRERLIDARQQFHVEGRYDLAVILFATATEVLIDGVLQMLWWEKSLTDPQITAATVAEAFESTKDSMARMKRHLNPLLGGDWSSSNGPVQRWTTQTWKLRHLCVHGGYYPTHAQTAAASNSSDEIANFLFDRLADKRTEFPRVCLQILAQSGLEKRKKWNGQIKRFAEHDAPNETNWNYSLKAFREEVEALRQ